MFQSYIEYTLPTLLAQGLNLAEYASFIAILQLINIVLNPVMLFILMYLVGRSLNLATTYRGTIAYLFLGALVGGLIGRTAIYLTSPAAVNGIATLSAISVESVESAIPVIFTGFSAAALAFFGRIRQPSLQASSPGKE